MGPASTLRQLGLLFLRIGVIGFGGPAAHIAMMQREFVQKRQWFSAQEFLEMVAVTNLIPGPNSTEMAMHIGSKRAGVRGLIVSGITFIVPAVVIVAAISWLYTKYGTNPIVFDIRYGVLPVIIAVIAHAVFSLSTSLLTSRSIDGRHQTTLFLTVFSVPVLCAVAYLLGANELLILLAAGVSSVLMQKRSGTQLFTFSVPLALAAQKVDLSTIAILFLKIGSVLYGSGYVLLAFLERELVLNRGLLSPQQLLDAVAIGQITPGPVFSTATFIGWQLSGVMGALVATVGIFGPSFLFVGLLTRILPWVKQHATAVTFLSGVTAASLGLMAGVLIRLTDTALTDVFTWSIGIVSLVILVKTKINSMYLITGGIAIGILHAIN